METVWSIVKNLKNVNKIYETLSLDRCYFNIKKKENEYYEFMLKQNIFNNTNSDNNKSVYELLILNKPTKKWQELYSTDNKEELVTYMESIKGDNDPDWDCEECIYYDAENNMCDGFDTKCECSKSFCLRYDSIELINFRKELAMDNTIDEMQRYYKKERANLPEIDIDIKIGNKDKITIAIKDKYDKGDK